DGDRVVAADADQDVVRVRHRDRVGVAADLGARQRVGADRLDPLFRGGVGYRHAVVVGVGDEERVAVAIERGRLQADGDFAFGFLAAEVDDGDGAGVGGAGRGI